MKNLQKINGMSHFESAHTVPLSSIPEMEEKKPKNQTLIEKCLKALIKERMSGHLVNKKRKQIMYSSVSVDNSEIQSINEQHNKKMKAFFTNRYETPARKSLPTSRQNSQKHIQRQRSLQNSKFSKDHHHQSFISAIESESDLKKSRNFQQAKNKLYARALKQKKERMNSEFQLPQIKQRKQSFNMNDKKAPVKNLFRNPQDNVKEEIWNIFCERLKIKDKQKKRKGSFKDDLLTSATKSILKRNRQSTTKQQVLLYISELPSCLKKLVQYLMIFFDIKLPNEISLTTYGKTLQVLKNVQSRGWAFFAFSFWDTNKDGSITSEDIFAHFQDFYLKESENSSKIAIVQEAARIFQKQMNELNKKFPLKTYQEQPQNPEESENIKYLEEVLLRKKNIKFKEMENIINSSEQAKNSAPQISLFPKDLTVKCSSSYKQCFIATQHNEETRLSREEIEKYKLELKKIKKERNRKIRQTDVEEQRSIKEITYEKFVEENYGMEVKKIIWMVLGIN